MAAHGVTAESYLERELKFDVPAGFATPDDLGGLAAATEAHAQRLRSEYYDTADFALRAAAVTLRRRTGDADQGWQLKIPRPPAREELRLPLGPEGEPVPAEFDLLLQGIRRGQPLRPVAVLTTDRTVTGLLDAGGATLAELADDSVHAATVGDTVTASAWRELEIELGSGDEELLQQLAELVRGHGAEPATAASKLARALGDGTVAPADPLTAYLGEQQRMLLAGDLALRRGDASVIHKTRVASRRFRSTLRTFGPLFDEAVRTRLDAELRWYAALLGDVRDRQVLDRRLLSMLDELDDTLVLGPVRARIEHELSREQGEHWAGVQQALTGERYLVMLTEVNDFILSLPAETGSHRKLLTLMRRADRKVTGRLRAAVASDDPALMHRTRKAAKRARYAGEAMVPLAGRRAAKQARRNEKLQELFGEFQDSLVSAELLKRLGLIAGTTPGENGFTYGLLYQSERDRAAAIRRRAHRIARKRG
ncbi:MAG TPA: CYTH and CHAD domain-containing protein [Jatrophihabitans sp.]|nr:CYTH and CHAD domain-containing protein [Jatrophihabitans sp.]